MTGAMTHPEGGTWCGELWRVWFNLTLMVFSLLFVACAGVVALLRTLAVVDVKTADSASVSVASVCYRLMFFCNPQVRSSRAV